MKILIVSNEGDGLGMAQRLAMEGHDVDVYVRKDRYDRAGRGIVGRVPSWEDHIRGADLVLADCIDYGRFEKAMREGGRPFLGFNQWMTQLERDRALGMEMFQRAGITIPETYEFNGRSEAKAIPKEMGFDGGWVVKPSGNLDTDKTVLCKEEEGWDRACQQVPEKCNGIVQRLVSGIEVSTEGWFNGREWLRPFNHTFEEKRFLAGNLGCNTGCMGNVVINAGSGNRLTKATIEPLSDFLRMIDYRGPVDVNCIVTEGDANALEITSRFGFDAIEALIEGLDEPLGDMLLEVAEGQRQYMALTDEIMIAVRLSIPPWPVRNPDADQFGEPVLGINDDTLHHLFLCDIYRDSDGVYKTAGSDGILLKATAIGRVRNNEAPEGKQYKPDYTYEARRRVYRLLDKISVGSKQYRTDIGERVNKDVDQLRKWGWL